MAPSVADQRPIVAASSTESLARRWARYAVNMVVSGTVVVLGISMGRQVIRWWSVESPNGSPRARAEEYLRDSPIGPEDAPQDFWLGDAPVQFRRQSFRGKFPELVEAMQRDAVVFGERALQQLRSLPSVAAPESMAASPSVAPAQEEFERAFLDQTPLCSVPGIGDVYLQALPVPVLAVLTPGMSSGAGEVGGKRRMLSWSIAFPTGDGEDDQWTMFVCGMGCGQSTTRFLELPAPPGGNRVLTLGQPSGSRMVTFQGRESLAAWTAFYSDWFGSQGASQLAPWRLELQNAYAQFAQANGARYDMQIFADGELLRALVIISGESKR